MNRGMADEPKSRARNMHNRLWLSAFYTMWVLCVSCDTNFEVSVSGSLIQGSVLSFDTDTSQFVRVSGDGQEASPFEIVIAYDAPLITVPFGIDERIGTNERQIECQGAPSWIQVQNADNAAMAIDASTAMPGDQAAFSCRLSQLDPRVAERTTPMYFLVNIDHKPPRELASTISSSQPALSGSGSESEPYVFVMTTADSAIELTLSDTTGDQAFSLACQPQPDWLVIDPQMPKITITPGLAKLSGTPEKVLFGCGLAATTENPESAKQVYFEVTLHQAAKPVDPSTTNTTTSTTTTTTTTTTPDPPIPVPLAVTDVAPAVPLIQSGATYSPTWTTPADPTINAFDVKACTNQDCVTGCLAEVSGSSPASIAINSLVDGSSYFMCVRSKNAQGGTSAFVVSGTTVTRDATSPSAVTQVTPLTILDHGSSSYTPTWTGGGDAHPDGFNLTACTDVACSTGCLTTATAATSGATALSGFTELTAYYVCVQAKDLVGNTAAFVPSAATITIDTVSPASPTNVSPAVQINSATASYTATWTGPIDASLDHYNLKSCVSNTCTGTCTTAVTAASSGSTAITSMLYGSQYVCVQSEDRAGHTSSWQASTAPYVRELSVEPVYADHSDWNNYVQNDGTDIYTATDTACPGSGSGYDTCLHAGEMRMSVVSLSSCTGWTGSDALGVFTWTCVDGGSDVTFYTSGFQSGKGLADLLNATSWKSNSLSITDGTDTYVSSATQWWTNTVSALPVNNGGADTITSLNSAGTIYTLAASDTSAGYSIDADEIGIVTLSGATLGFGTNTANNCNLTTGEVGTPANTCLVLLGNQNYSWIEGSYGNSGTPENYTILVSGATSAAKYNRLHQVTASNSQTPIYFHTNASNNKLTQVTVHDGSYMGIDFNNADYNLLDYVYVKSIGKNGIFLQNGSDDNRLKHLFVANTGITPDAFNNNGAGLNINNSSRNYISDFHIEYGSRGVDITASLNRLTRGIVANTIERAYSAFQGPNYYTEIRMVNNSIGWFNDANANGNKVVGLTTVNDSSQGIKFQNADNSTVLNHLSVNDAAGGDIASGCCTSENNWLAQIMISHATSIFTNNNSASSLTGNKAQGLYLVGTGACASTPISNGDCSAKAPSDYTLITSVTDLTTSLHYKVTADVAENASDTNGAATFPGAPASFDWYSFDKPTLQAWGIEGSAFPNADHRGRWSSGSGRIWDLSLVAADTTVKNRTDTGTSDNAAFPGVSTDPCPSAVDGNDTLSNVAGEIFLRNAMEIIDPDQDVTGFTGDDDGLCETAEACLYMPNFGGYQGHGNFSTNACQFNDGVSVTGVKIYAYPTNGY